MIVSSSLIRVDGGPPVPWSQFVADNADGFDPEEFAAIAAALRETGVYQGGGGAAAEFTLTVAESA